MSKTTADNSPSGAEDQEQEELGAAGSQLSTAPREEPVSTPGLGVIGWVRWFWRQLTSMRVALLLLLLLSLGAIPGSLIPQTGADINKVQAFRDAHKTLAPIYDKLGLFHVYSSVWFSAVYILLFVSLIGCIVPRTWQFVGQLRGRPPGAPKRLDRLPAYTTWRTTADPEQIREAALALLKKRRFRAHAAGDAVAAEKGYVRELGNLVFHVALIVLLVAFASGQMYKSDGTKLMVEGDGFSNALPMYDDFKSGSLFRNDDLVPFSFDLKDFRATYEVTGPNRGTARTFEAKIAYSKGAYGKERPTTIKVNEPLKIDDAKVYLVSHGYAPVITVRDAKGKVVYHDAVPLLPLDGNVTSQGVIKVMDGYRNAQGKKEQLGIKAFFLPTYGGGDSVLSEFPALLNPVLHLEPYHGSLGVDAGIPQSVYQLDKTHMKDYKDAKGKQLLANLRPGQTMKLPGGAGSVTFGKTVKEWAGFEIVQEPGSGWALGGALAAIFGLAASLFIQRRRVWVRAVRGADGVTVVEMAGLGRSESAKVPEELGDLAGTLYDQAPGAVDPDDPSASNEASPASQVVPAEGAEK
ncbi:cytochrome c biogenesis protein ResB [Streptomyces pluripotens]|uniref:Cytochrome c biogenesis protein ResB n=1 Tax=Streptomyces pluripotens TaxID=1355015 RepID=A0A221NZQ3_9ACTN|nr:MULTISPECIES: cytochrome c biogenesis protein ResB [Streptomyces]ARP70744.1 cytochrome C biogenesis protein [Streptomyces pluripotens]ASN25005.1 cytochrome c biogenesis protein ResB [Streptomyces pluripotens]KIE27394.1 cytochrome C biogenesis protein [Streptomyces sp. MUSC 125]MCH0556551.1 cytochrome c biogenesis protein ResB [Streptomyces sp. MUM 16J]